MRVLMRRIRYVKTQNLNTGTQRSARKIKSPTLISRTTQTLEWGTHRTISTAAQNLNNAMRWPMAGVFRGRSGLLLVATGLGT
jgi:hypothetical protein